jgi:hypothetical protein
VNDLLDGLTGASARTQDCCFAEVLQDFLECYNLVWKLGSQIFFLARIGCEVEETKAVMALVSDERRVELDGVSSRA